MRIKTIVITGITGQLGQFFVNYIHNNLPDDYRIIGTRRHKSKQEDKFYFDTSRVLFETMDLTDACSIERLINTYTPDYFINTAANAFVGDSWIVPAQHIKTNTLGVLYQLEAIKKYSPLTRYFNLGSSEEFGEVSYSPQDENHPFSPLSPYAASKCAAHNLVRVYRKSYKLYAIQGIQFNFESELRGEMYVTRKITKAVVKIKKDILENKKIITPLEIGNLDSKRDWQYCENVCDAIWRMLNQDQYNPKLKNLKVSYGSILLPEAEIDARQRALTPYLKEYVVSSGETHSVREFIEKAFKFAGFLNLRWVGQGTEEILFGEYACPNECKEYMLVKVNPNFYRPADVQSLHGNSSAIINDLGWKSKVSFDELIEKMMSWDLKDVYGQPLTLNKG